VIINNVFSSPSSFLEKVKTTDNSSEDSDENINSPIFFEGQLLRKAKDGKLKKYWYVLKDKELYMYKSKTEETHKTMITLVSAFLTKDNEEKLDKKNTLYPFSLKFPNKTRTFYLVTSKEREQWMAQIKQAIGYADLKDYYEVKETLGRGKFGTVKLGIHKKSGQKVAIKVLNKLEMTLQDIELQKREIEVLKICQHPSIIRLLDVFESDSYIYIVMEYCKGGDMFVYLEKRDFSISESKAREIAHSLATGIFYLHTFGIVHRDLKPENILMTEDTDSGQPKIVDFGLSKIIGPEEM
jgi:hypothetical protein